LKLARRFTASASGFLEKAEHVAEINPQITDTKKPARL